ncbi:MAG: rRNA maturation RNase YbeY [Streptococcaceae bacterium]|jgi:probable rRNA maturation factor|nr:rRNA maturation RNase YbeY [Streptococcaceae bacterium]
MEIELNDEIGQISKSEAQQLIKLLQYAADYLNLHDNQEMSITFVDNEKIRVINHKYRGKDMPTDVVSLEYQPEVFDFSDFGLEASEAEELNVELNSYLGELFISVDKAREQAARFGHSYARELGFLAVHGFLHINGYDHMTSEDEQEMFTLQKEILDNYGLKRE